MTMKNVKFLENLKSFMYKKYHISLLRKTWFLKILKSTSKINVKSLIMKLQLTKPNRYNSFV